ncbi:MAG: prepilin peptidase [Nitrosarchaeum sp.]|nr:prepilin peptidase [Nitrosarchaeum sp.]MCA9819498.1 prepilin peptidase [Nitrosarchaeum sp.]
MYEDSTAIIEFVRIIILIAMLGAASYFDVKTRKIPDLVWLIFGGFGAILYVFDWQSVTSYHILSMIVAAATSLLLYLYRLTGTADVFVILGIAVVLPVSYEFVMVPITVLIGTATIVAVLVTLYNVILNLLGLVKNKTLFPEFAEPRHRKVLALFFTHRKRRWEKFVTPAESFSSTNRKSFVLSAWNRKPVSNQLQIICNQNTTVQNIIPFVTCLFGVSLLLMFPQMIHLFLAR